MGVNWDINRKNLGVQQSSCNRGIQNKWTLGDLVGSISPESKVGKASVGWIVLDILVEKLEIQYSFCDRWMDPNR